jgi:multiple antibiotic resistance protein
MSFFVSTFLMVFAATLPIVNPASGALIFLDLTKHLPVRARRNLARLIAIYSFLVLNGSLYVGAYLLDFFGISIGVLRVAGGIVVAAAGWRFLNEQTSDDDEPAAAVETAPKTPRVNYLSQAFYPLTMPLTTGPGTISVMIALGTSQEAYHSLGQHAAFAIAALAATTLLALLIYISYAFASQIRHVLGNTGTTIALRLSAFILFCIGVQIFWNGLSDLIGSLKTH